MQEGGGSLVLHCARPMLCALGALVATSQHAMDVSVCKRMAEKHAVVPSNSNGWVSLSKEGTRLWVAAGCDHFFEDFYREWDSQGGRSSGVLAPAAGGGKAECLSTQADHGVVAGQSWGSLNDEEILRWKSLNCDQYLCQDTSMAGKASYDCIKK